MKRRVSQLTRADISEHSIWEFLPETEERDETWVRPVSRTPVNDLTRRLVGINLRLASGQTVPAILGNIALRSKRHTEHFLTVTLFRADGQTFDLSRYHDVGANQRGPAALADFLKMNEAAVFPMSYDISSVATGLPEVVSGEILREPRERLSRHELIELAIQETIDECQ
ncbi:MAG: hypothetical protein JXB62_15285 [Pirellulales bacterium]|nr:hypothetical protein [Pirellulales bacterium]